MMHNPIPQAPATTDHDRAHLPAVQDVRATPEPKPPSPAPGQGRGCVLWDVLMRADHGIADDGPDPGIRRLEFEPEGGFQTELRRRIDEHFRCTGARRHDCWQMYVKSALILATFAGSYGLLVWGAQTLWQGMFLAAVLALSMVAIGFNIQHDGGHRAFSRHPVINRVMALTLDLIGESSLRWHWKHGVIHHRFVNITGYDTDVDLGLMARFTPHQPQRWWHRWQHLYLWPIYALLAMKMQVLDDFSYLLTGQVGRHRVPRPRGRELFLLATGKAVFFVWAFAVPMLVHPFWMVLLFYVGIVALMGIVIALVFIIPHVQERAVFPIPLDETGCIPHPWSVHQALATVNFSMQNRFLTWLLGGLNFHKEHHLFPVICHVNYPAMAPMVQAVCQEYGLPYHAYGSLCAGIAAHYRWLRKLGSDPANGQIAPT